MPSIRRVVREPQRWDRIVAVAAQSGGRLPQTPDSRALADFLAARKAADPDGFSDLSTTIIKLLGPGDYVVDRPGADPPGPLRPGGQGLHALDRAQSPLSRPAHAAAREGVRWRAVLLLTPSTSSMVSPSTARRRRTRRTRSSGRSANRPRRCWSVSRIGQQFDAIVTGASDKGTWVRVASPPIEGKLVGGDARSGRRGQGPRAAHARGR